MFRFRALVIKVLGKGRARKIAPLGHAGRKAAARMFLAGEERHCPCCSSDLKKFVDHGIPTRTNSRCPACGALERHRLMWRYLSDRTDLLSGAHRRMLHIAPERQLTNLLTKIPGTDYLSADIDPGTAMVEMDVTDIKYPDDSFDFIYCSHVLEHVPDDTAAMSELRRVLAPGGFAILQVPFVDGPTREDPTVTDRDERIRLFGQEDHVRAYGDDGVYEGRLTGAGFDVTADDYVQGFSDADIARLGFERRELIYVCR